MFSRREFWVSCDDGERVVHFVYCTSGLLLPSSVNAYLGS